MMRLMQRLLAAALLACYGILGAIATGPHGHEAGPPAPSHVLHGPVWQAGGFPLDSGDTTAPRAHCPLCAWSRTQVLPGTSAACAPAPARPGIRSFTHTTAGWPPAVRGVLLRAPPTA